MPANKANKWPSRSWSQQGMWETPHTIHATNSIFTYMKTTKINNLWIGKYTSSSHGWHSFVDLFCQSLQLYSSWKSEVKDFWRLRYNHRESAGTLGWYPSCLSPPKRPLEGGIPNKYPLYRVYMGLIIKGTVPRVPWFSLWYKISSLFLNLEGDVLEASVSSDVSGSLFFF